MASLAVSPASSPLVAKPQSVLGWRYAVDHPANINRWEQQVPLVYPLLIGLQTAHDVAKAPVGEKKRTALYDTIALSLAAIGTVAATRLFMKPDKAVLATTQAGLRYLQQQYPTLLQDATQSLKHLGHPLAGQNLATVLQQQPERLDGRAVGVLLGQLKHQSQHPWTPGRVDTLLSHVVDAVQERARQQVGHEQTHWPQRLQEQLQRAGWRSNDPQTLNKSGVQRLLNATEMRLLLPFDEEWDVPLHLFNAPPKQALRSALQATRKDFLEDVLPFFATGITSIGSGMVGGLLANRVTGGSRERSQNILNEGIFQMVSNIFMCAAGAMGGLTVANLLGLSSHSRPVGRFTAIAGGLAAGIGVGAATANTVSQRWVGPLVDRLMPSSEPAAATAPASVKPAFQTDTAVPEGQPGQEQPYGGGGTQGTGRQVCARDLALHVDDLGMIFALMGGAVANLLVPLAFYAASTMSAVGFRNGKPCLQSDDKHLAQAAQQQPPATPTRTADVQPTTLTAALPASMPFSASWSPARTTAPPLPQPQPMPVVAAASRGFLSPSVLSPSVGGIPPAPTTTVPPFGLQPANAPTALPGQLSGWTG